jgi:hypothetical protein
MNATVIDGELLRGLLIAEQEDRSLIVGPSGVDVVGRIADAAMRHGCSAIVGASEAGQRLVGALLLSHPDSFHVWSPGEADAVMVIEGVAVGDVAVVRVMDEVLRRGARAAFGVLVAPAETTSLVQPGRVEVVSKASR